MGVVLEQVSSMLSRASLCVKTAIVTRPIGFVPVRYHGGGCCSSETQTAAKSSSSEGCCGGSKSESTGCCSTESQPLEPTDFTPSPGQPSDAMKMTRRDLLTLYKNLIKEGLKMPTQNRQNFIREKVRQQFKKHATLVDEAEIDLQRRLALTCVDAVQVQQEHLNTLFASDIAELVKQQKETKRLREMEGQGYSEYFGKTL
eukprot:c2742_g1_i2.p1 GENE.c2742_g1_i2~~c2742_g1_i2.p1  ORF type:complete len:201 (+),score=37.95 c2742_g1_i2:1-603(+)